MPRAIPPLEVRQRRRCSPMHCARPLAGWPIHTLLHSLRFSLVSLSLRRLDKPPILLLSLPRLARHRRIHKYKFALFCVLGQKRLLGGTTTQALGQVFPTLKTDPPPLKSSTPTLGPDGTEPTSIFLLCDHKKMSEIHPQKVRSDPEAPKPKEPAAPPCRTIPGTS